MSTDRAQLLSRKDDLVEALRALERDRENATVDEGAYDRARDRYETEAANILERLDQTTRGTSGAAPATRGRRSPRFASAVAMSGVVVAIVILMASALRARGVGESTTGSLPPTVSIAAPISADVRAAEKVVSRHLHNSADWFRLGQAQLGVGNVRDGTSALKLAIRLNPRDAEARTALAISLGSRGQIPAALGYLSDAERAQPRYARAWFADGLIATRSPATLRRGIASWKRFLVLQPKSPVGSEVRVLLRAAEGAARP